MIIPNHLFVMQVRKAAHEAVTVLLKKLPGDMTHHPACGATAKFCVQQIEEHGGKWNTDQIRMLMLHICF